MNSSIQRQRLDNKVAIITGATGGIGEATAKLFLDLGARVMLVARSAEKLADTKGRLEHRGDVAGSISDATDEAGMAAAVAATLDRFGGLDILIANAGTEGVAKPMDVLSVEEFENTMRTNVTGVWLAMKHCIAPPQSAGRRIDRRLVINRRVHRISGPGTVHRQQARRVRARKDRRVGARPVEHSRQCSRARPDRQPDD